jgi:hypothetical protein
MKKFNQVQFIKGQEGEYRFITKCKAGFLTVHDAHERENEYFSNNKENLLTSYKKGALQTIQFKPKGSDYWFTVFARVGKKIHLIDEEILESLTVGTINQYWYNTDLYNQSQYDDVNATTWASWAYKNNMIAGVDFSKDLENLNNLSLL